MIYCARGDSIVASVFVDLELQRQGSITQCPLAVRHRLESEGYPAVLADQCIQSDTIYVKYAN